MAELHDEEYAWDHAGETLTENSPLLGDHSSESSNFLTSYNRHDHITISRRQAEYLLHTLQDNTTLVHTLLLAGEAPRDPLRQGSCRGCATVIRLVQDGVLLVTIVLQVLTVIILSVLETLEKTSKSQHAASVLVVTSQTLNFAVFAISIPRLVWMIWRRTYSRVYLIEMYVTSTLVFAGMYLMTYSLDQNGWLFTATTHSTLTSHSSSMTSSVSMTSPASATSPSAMLSAVASDLLVVTYVRMLHTSVCTASLFGNPAYVAVTWYNHLLQIAQLCLSVTLVLCLVSQAISHSSIHRRQAPVRLRRSSLDSVSSRGSGHPFTYGTLDSNTPSRA